MSEVTEILDAMRSGDFENAVPRARELPEAAFREVAEILEQCDGDVDRRNCYWVLSKIAITSRSRAVGEYAVRRIELETKVKLKVEALDVVMWTRGVTEYEPVLAALGSGNREMNRKAIAALGACTGEEAERALLDVLQHPARPGLAHEAATSLARMCEPSATETLQGVFGDVPRKKSNEPLLAALVFAFGRNPVPSSTELVRAELESTRLWMTGWACSNHLAAHGDESDVPRVSAYLEGFFKRMKRGTTIYNYALTLIDYDYHTEITAALATLKNVGDGSLGPFAIAFDPNGPICRIAITSG